MLLAGLIVLGLCTSLFRQQLVSKMLTLVFSVLCTLMAVWGLWRPDAVGLHSAYLALTPFRTWFLFTLGVVSLASSWYRFGYKEHDTGATAFWLPVFLVSMVAVVTAENMWVFMTAWETMSITSFFLVISYKNRSGVLESGYLYLVMSQLSALSILSGLLLMTASMHSMNFGVWSSTAHVLSPATKSWIFGLLGLGFAVKSGIIPFHIWLPRAHPVAPAPVSGLMSGAMIKLGVFGIVQFLLVDLGQTSIVWPIILLLMGAVSSLLGVLYALMEQDLKRLLAYSSIENIGIIFLGLGIMALGIQLNHTYMETLGLLAALFHTFNHAIFKSQLFLAAGAVEQHTGTLNAEDLGGLIRTIPGVAVGFLAGSMAISALPPFNGFISEWITFRGLLSMVKGSAVLWSVFGLSLALILAMTGALAAMSFVKASGVIFLGEPRRQLAKVPIPRSMTWPILGLAACNLAFGVVPTPVLRIISSMIPGAVTPSSAVTLPLHATTTAVILLAVLCVVMAVARPWQLRTVPRWSCGRTPDAAMQFTSAAFTKSVRTTLAVIYRPHRNLTRIGRYPQDFPQRLVYHGGTTPIWERYVYEPTSRLVWWLSTNSTRIQAGPVRLYLIYLLGTVAVMLLFLH